MAKYRRQHFVPVCYPRSFSVDQTKKNRDSKLFKFTRAERAWSGPVKAEKECCGDDHYSAAEREASENDLQRVESEYSAMSRKVYEQGFGALSEEERYNLQITMLLLFVRNPIHRHSDVGGEEIERTRTRFPAALKLLAPGHRGPEPTATLQERLARQEGRGAMVAQRDPCTCGGVLRNLGLACCTGVRTKDRRPHPGILDAV